MLNTSREHNLSLPGGTLTSAISSFADQARIQTPIGMWKTDMVTTTPYTEVTGERGELNSNINLPYIEVTGERGELNSNINVPL